MSDIILDPEKDGITHINVYTKGKTPLGRMLTNISNIPFSLEDYGSFSSAEGYWFWLRLNKNNNEFRTMDAFAAKKQGSLMVQSPFNDVKPVDDIFKEEFKKGIRAKLKQNKHILFELLKTDLPLTHYYVQGMVVKNKSEHQWQLDEIERIRDFCHKKMFEVGQLTQFPVNREEIKKLQKPRFK